jgi:hypothetical protein
MREQIRWICTGPDGVVEIVAAAPLEDLRKIGITTVDEIRELCLGKSFAGRTDIQEMPPGWEPPADRTFRNAWKIKGKSAEGVEHAECADIEVDMPRAREIHKDFLRRKRVPLLEDLDIEYQRADERGDQQQKKAVAAKKQALRDVTDDPRIAAAKTPDDLKAVTVAS